MCILFELRKYQCFFLSFFVLHNCTYLYGYLLPPPTNILCLYASIHTYMPYIYNTVYIYIYTVLYIYIYILHTHTLSLTLLSLTFLLLPPLYSISTGFGDVPAAQSGARGNHLLLRRGRQRPARIPQRKYLYILLYYYPYYYYYYYYYHYFLIFCYFPFTFVW